MVWCFLFCLLQNFIPSTASNQIDMWHRFDVDVIRRELQWAADLGYNGLRVFLHDQLYAVQGENAFLDKVDQFLDLAWHQFGMRTVLVLLEGIWDPHPDYDNATTVEPRPRVHNSRWLQSPGRKILEADDDAIQEAALKPYVQAVVQRFGNDSDRVLLLDLFDQPENDNRYSYGDVGDRVPAARDARGQEMDPLRKAQCIERLLPRLLDWVRSVGNITVPVTLAAWDVLDPVSDPVLAHDAELYLLRDRLRHFYLSASDVITFHNYDNVTYLMHVLNELKAGYAGSGRPIVCTSYMARESHSTFDPVLGRLYRENVWAFNWGLVAGQTQTMYNATTWNVLPVSASGGDGEPVPWHHDVLRDDGTPYLPEEKQYLLSYRPLGNEKQRHPPSTKPEAPLDAGTNQSFVFTDAVLVGMAVVLLGAIGWLWRRRERSRQRFTMVEDLEDSFVADLELRPMD